MISLVSLLFAAHGSFAAPVFSAEEKKCKANTYCADKMVCVSRVSKPEPKGMVSDYFVEIVSIRVIKTTKNLGGGKKTLVDSMQMNANPVGSKEPQITLAQAKAKADFEWGNYGSPAKVTGKNVWIGWGSDSNFSRGIRLKIESSTMSNGVRTDYLTGSEQIVGDVVSNHTRTFECEAIVVDTPSRVDDFTR